MRGLHLFQQQRHFECGVSSLYLISAEYSGSDLTLTLSVAVSPTLSLSRTLNKSDDVLVEEFNRAILVESLLDFGAIHIDDDVPEMESAVVISVGAL